MPFWIALTIIGSACTLITYRTLVGYEKYSKKTKFLVLILLLIGWFGPSGMYALRAHGLIGVTAGAVLAKTAYFLTGISFLLIVFILVRDLIWSLIYLITRKPSLDLKNMALLRRNNMLTLALVLIVAGVGAYEAYKAPNIERLEIEDPRILQETRLVVASDFHIDAATPLARVKMFVDRINAQNPDYVLLVGDLIDDNTEVLAEATEELSKIKAEKVYLSLGNHEYYNDAVKWMMAFTKAGLTVLQNTGETLQDTGLFIGGIPDANSTDINMKRVMVDVITEDPYKVLMSHTPQTINLAAENGFDLQFSGHTHGGQIFPFHFPVEAFNGYLAGMYNVGKSKLFVTRGAGYWGPAMRLFAPSDIVVVDFKPATDTKESK